MDNELVHLHILFGMFEPVIFRGDFDYPLSISKIHIFHHRCITPFIAGI